MKTPQTLSDSWLNGKYPFGEINTSFPYVSIINFFQNGEDMFLQGEEAQAAIDEINAIYNASDCTVEEAVQTWMLNA